MSYRQQVFFYTTLALLVVGLPALQLWRGASVVIWGPIQLFNLVATLYLLWMYRPRLDVLGCSVLRGPRGRGQLALTFDDGPNGEDTAAVLDVLLRHGARATFFCVGRQAERYPDLIQRMVNEGHAVGNHTQNHRKLGWLSCSEVEREIQEAQAALRRAGAPSPRLFRAPHGVKSPTLLKVLRHLGMPLCAWSHDPQDFQRPGLQELLRRTLPGLRDGAIVLLHDGGGDRSQTALALETILLECRRLQLETVRLDDWI